MSLATGKLVGDIIIVVAIIETDLRNGRLIDQNRIIIKNTAPMGLFG